MLDYLILIGGLALLVVGGDILVRGAVGLAERLHVPPLIIGLTIVAFGTSAPEMFVSVQAALEGAGGIAIGNVVGSNIANVLLVLSLPSLIRRTDCKEEGNGKNLLVMLGLMVVFMGMMSKGSMQRYDGIILLIILSLFLYDQYRSATDHRRRRQPTHDYHEDVENIPTSQFSIWAMLIGGLITLPIGAELTVFGATSIALEWGVSEEVIGLTIVAIGTSLPELATSLIAVWRKSLSVAIGNVVGSNIFNIAAIMGVTAAIIPVPVADRVIYADMWMMLAASLLLVGLAHYNIAIGRRIGLAMFTTYAIYIAGSFLF